MNGKLLWVSRRQLRGYLIVRQVIVSRRSSLLDSELLVGKLLGNHLARGCQPVAPCHVGVCQ